MTGFRVNPHGFNIEFENGYSVSVQFGPGNYCSNRAQTSRPCDSCHSAEVLIFDPAGNPYGKESGWTSADKAAKLIAKAANL